MSEKFNDSYKSCVTISGVICDAKNCRHHTKEGKCSASSIKVENNAATRKSDTWCGTFTPCC